MIFSLKSTSHSFGALLELAARLAGQSPVIPRQRFTVANDPGLYPTSPDPDEPKVVDLSKIEFFVEDGAKALSLVLSGRNDNIETWKLDWRLYGPNNEEVKPNSPGVINDPFFDLVQLDAPSKGIWVLKAWSENGDLQKSALAAYTRQPDITFFTDAQPRAASPDKPVQLTAVPSYFSPLESDVALDARVRRPDGSDVWVVLKQDPRSGLWSADFDQFVGRGVYQVFFNLEVGSQARQIAGESIFDGPERPTSYVPAFNRSASASFSVVTGDFPDCTSEDCDGDGLPNKYECGSDTDGDGIPNIFDLDSDSDDAPDSQEGLVDVNGNGLPDACDPSYPKLIS